MPQLLLMVMNFLVICGYIMVMSRCYVPMSPCLHRSKNGECNDEHDDADSAITYMAPKQRVFKLPLFTRLYSYLQLGLRLGPVFGVGDMVKVRVGFPQPHHYLLVNFRVLWDNQPSPLRTKTTMRDVDPITTHRYLKAPAGMSYCKPVWNSRVCYEPGVGGGKL